MTLRQCLEGEGGTKILQAIYVGAAFFSLIMIVDVFVFPGSMYCGNVQGGRECKYSGYGVVQLTHLLPAGIWSIAVPLQTNAWFRKNNKSIHRATGYVFFSMSFLLMVGFAFIEYYALDWMHKDYGHIPIDEALSQIGLGWIPVLMFMRVLAVVFLLSGVLALRAIKSGDFVTHRKWVLRHIALGLWVCPQRIYLIFRYGATDRERKANFSDAVYVGLAVTVPAAELAILIYRWQQQAAEADASAAEMQLTSKASQD